MNDTAAELPRSEGHHSDASEHVHVIGYQALAGVWLALLMLTALTVAVAGARLHGMSVLVAILVATVKSSLVLWIFMHLKFEHRVFKWFLLAALVTFSIFLALTFADVLFR